MMVNQITRFWDFIDTRSVITRIILFVTMWMTWKSFVWAADFANMVVMRDTIPSSSLEISTMIAAVTAPIAALQGYIFKVYVDARQQQLSRPTTEQTTTSTTVKTQGQTDVSSLASQ